MPSLEVLTMGRVSVDLYPEQIGVSLAEVRTFAKSLGGSPTNVAVGAARLGRTAAVVTKVGADGFGVYVRQALRGFGVDDRWVGTDPQLRTRSEEHTSELQSRLHLVCRLLLEKKKKKKERHVHVV